MSNPNPDNPPPPPAHQAGYVLTSVESLRHCSGWNEWLLPHLQKQLDAARKEVETAAINFQPIPPKAAATVMVIGSLILDYITKEEERALSMVGDSKR